METSKIITNTVKTIAETIAKGQFLRNGSNRLFEIAQVTETQVVLKSINGETEKTSILSKEVFCKLYYMGNYSQVTSPERFMVESIESKRTGADRFLIK
jgi:hypothetical protein